MKLNLPGSIGRCFLNYLSSKSFRLNLFRTIVKPLLFWLPLYFFSTANSQHNTGRLPVKLYGVSEGLPNAYVLTIFQDSQGFIWVGTAGGLSRFNGQRFDNFGAGEGFSNLYINHVYEDHNHRIWATSQTRIYQMAGDRFEPTSFSGNQKPSYIFRLQRLSDGHFWAFTNIGSFIWNNNQWHPKAFISENPGLIIREVKQTREGYLVISNHAIWLKLNDKNTLLALEPDAEGGADSPFFLAADSLDGEPVFFTRKGVYRLLPDMKMAPFPLPEAIAGRAVLGAVIKQHLWVYPIGSNFVYRIKQPKATTEIDSIFLRVNLLSHVFEDNEKRTWLATGEGLALVKNQQSHMWEAKDYPMLSGIRHLVCSPGNSVMAFGAEQTPVIWESLAVQNARRLKASLPNGDFPDVSLWDRNNKLWLLSRRGNLYTGNERGIAPVPWKLQPIQSRMLAYDKATHRIWLATDSLISMSAAKPASRQAILKISPNFATCISPDYLYIHSSTNGSQLVNTHSAQVTSISSALGLEEDVFRAKVYPDTDSTFWLYHFGGGIRLFKYTLGKNWVPLAGFSTREGLPSDAVHHLLKDGQGNIWLATAAGIAVLKPDETGARPYKLYRLSDLLGFDWEQAEFVHFDMDSKGAVWISNQLKVVCIPANSLVFEPQQPSLAILKVQFPQYGSHHPPQSILPNLYGTAIGSKKHEFPYHVKSIRVQIAGIAYNNSQPFLYAYQLTMNGKPSGWNLMGNQTEVLLSSLEPGNYVWMARTKQGSSEWSQPVFFQFEIKPPFWEYWWFRLLVIFTAAGIVFYLFGKRIRALQQKSAMQQQLVELEMKATKAQMNPHFIYNALNSIQALVAGSRNREAMDYIGRFSRLLRQVLEASDSHTIPLGREIQTLQHYISLETLRLNFSVTTQTDVAKGINTEELFVPPLLLQPFVENSLWHGFHEGIINPTLVIGIEELPGHWLLITITDNGIGRLAAKRASSENHVSKGIEICRQRILNYNAPSKREPVVYQDLYDEQGKSAGTRVSLFLKMNT